MINKIVVLCGERPSPSENNAATIAEFLGTEATVIPVGSARELKSLSRLIPRCAALIVHSQTLLRIAEGLDDGLDGLLALTALAEHIFIFGFDRAEDYGSLLRTVSLGAIEGVAPLLLAETEFKVTETQRELCRQFSGLSFKSADPAHDACFVEGTHPGTQAVLIRAGGQPFFVRVGHDGSEVFFAASRTLADLGDRVSSEAGLLPHFSRLAPLMIFLRRALGDHLWHSEIAQASFIIDDPWLRNRYGFLEYSKLLQAIDQERISVCLAFIPWNYARSRKQIAGLLAGAAVPPSLCVHGCDHTEAEFAAKDARLLVGKARLALDRMRRHTQRFGIPFDDVMVFPQGLFSVEAARALAACGYLAAVNTDVCPVDMPKGLALRDWMDVAVTAFTDLPLFGRHYPRDPAEFAFDLFLGKPALVVEHHGYFRQGYGALRAFARRLNELDERLEWSGLATICSRACLKKVTASGEIHVRCYTNRFKLTNTATRPQAYVLFQRRTAGGVTPAVTVNGQKLVGDQQGDNLTFSLSLQSGGTADIRIQPQVPASASLVTWTPSRAHKARVFVRRSLCDFRDNYIETNSLLEALLSQARRLRAGNGKASVANSQSAPGQITTLRRQVPTSGYRAAD